MKSFFSFFLACLLALIVFTGLLLLVVAGMFSSYLVPEKAVVPDRSVLVVDLSHHFREIRTENPFLLLSGSSEDEVPALYDLVRMIREAKTDSAIKGIYVVANGNANGFAASEEIRNALSAFRESGKFIIAYGDYMTQKSYHVANVADRIYCNPKGDLDWRGFSVEYMYFKNLMKKLDVEAQIFYDGKYKSATEPFREDHMTAENRLQTEVWLGDMYGDFLAKAAAARNLDTASLHDYANQYLIASPAEAVRYKLIDGVKYDDEVKAEIKQRLKLQDDDKINFVTPGTYRETVSFTKPGIRDKIAIVYAEGEIMYGRSEDSQIGSEEYRNLIRKLRYNKDIKAIVLRVNSPGGSSLASEIIWRELDQARKAGKPVVVSMGDVAASGGYYISCNADSIFAQPNTITGSIGVFSIIPNMESFFRNKLGITFDRVKTAAYADALTVTRPLKPDERKIIQREVDNIYMDFKQRVAEGRKLDTALVDSIAQGRVWTGIKAVEIGLADRLGSIDDAIEAAAKLAGLKTWAVREYPEPVSPFDKFIERFGHQYQANVIRGEIGDEQFELLRQVKRIRDEMGRVQALLPFSVDIQ